MTDKDHTKELLKCQANMMREMDKLAEKLYDIGHKSKALSGFEVTALILNTQIDLLTNTFMSQGFDLDIFTEWLDHFYSNAITVYTAKLELGPENLRPDQNLTH